MASHDNDLLIQRALSEGAMRYEPDTGLVFSLRANHPNRPIGTITAKGYLRSKVSLNGKSRAVMVHRIACIAAHGQPPSPRHQVNHIDANKTNNRASNLEWSTNQSNCKHAGSLGLMGLAKGEQHYRAKLTSEDVRSIRDRYAEAIKGRQRATRGFMKDLCAEFGMSRMALRLVAIGKSYSSVR